MTPRDTGSKRLRSVTQGDLFTSAERERLVTLLHDYTNHAEYSEFMLDPAELEFTRWLYEHGRIGEHPEQAS